jgi:hypothetical protein
MLPPALVAWVFLRHEALTARGTGPLPPPAPQIIFLDQPYDWVATAVNVAQFVLLATLTYYIFQKQYRQKTLERHAEWYHRVVTDFAVEKITRFAEVAHGTLTTIAKELLRLKAMSAPSGDIDEVVKRGLADFKVSLYVLSRSVAGRLAVFEDQLARSFRRLCDGLEDDLSEWCDEEAAVTPGESRRGISPILDDWQSNSLKLIRDYEFNEWE